MKFRNTVDVAAPIEVVFAEASDFVSIEKMAKQRGIDVQRLDVLENTGPGMVWDVAFEFRGKPREMEIELTRFIQPNEMQLVSRSSSFAGLLEVEFLALSRTQTRVSALIELKPQNLTARLMVQSLKLVRSNLIKRMHKRMSTWAGQIENRYKVSGVS